jgi:hypothetical protein
MTQPGLDWDRDVSLPVSGRSSAARHAGATGAQQAVRGRGAVTLAYVALLRQMGPLSDHEAAKLLGRQVSSVNSIRNGLADRVRPSGAYQDTEFGTRRVRWELA